MTIAHSPTTSTSLSTRVARVEQHGRGGGGGDGEGGGASRAADGSYRPRPQPQRHAQAGGCWAGASGYARRMSQFGTSVFAIGTLTACGRGVARAAPARRRRRRLRCARRRRRRALCSQPHTVRRSGLRVLSPGGRSQAAASQPASVCACTCVGPTALVVYTGSFVHTSY
jgi:hypothetical protein